MTVSNEDREAAIAAAALGIAQRNEDEAHYFKLDATDAVDALIAHGWRPPSTVTRERIAERLGPALALNDDLVQLLREHGIEVTDDRPE